MYFALSTEALAGKDLGPELRQKTRLFAKFCLELGCDLESLVSHRGQVAFSG